MTSIVILKPDAVRRRLVANILNRYEREGFQFQAMELRPLKSGEIDSLYCQYVEREFMPRLRGAMHSGPCAILAVYHEEGVGKARQIALEIRLQLKDPYETNPACNLIHASDSVPAAVRETQLFFPGESP